MRTMMKVTLLAKKLRTELRIAQAKHVASVTKYKRDVLNWKKQLSTWLKVNGESRVAAISSSEIKGGYRYGSERPGFDTSGFFAGAPKPPTFPSDQQIKDIRAALRHFGITGQANVAVDDDDLKKWFGSEANSEED